MPIPGFPHHKVDECGTVINTRTGQIVRPRRVGANYLGVLIKHAGTRKGFYIHRLVALEFLPAPEGGRNIVNHKDGDKHNNHFSNLEWVTNQENHDHAKFNGMIDKCKPMQAESQIPGRPCFWFPSLASAVREGYSSSAILRALKTGYTYSQHKWRRP